MPDRCAIFVNNKPVFVLNDGGTDASARFHLIRYAIGSTVDCSGWNRRSSKRTNV